MPADVLVNAAGSPPLQIVSPPDIDPAVGTACTVTVTAVVAADSHATLLSVLIVILLYCVVAVNPLAISKVEAEPISEVQDVPPSVDFSQR